MSALRARPVPTAAAARLLALGFAPPTPERIGRTVALAGSLAEATGSPAAAAVGDAFASAGEAELAVEHERLFGVDGACPPYEGLWERDPFREWRGLADVAGFYAACGAHTGGALSDRPDHAGCELEFLAFLALREDEAARAGAGGDAELCRETADAFLREHLGRFLGRLCAETREATSSPAYSALAAWGESWIAEELTGRGLEPVPVVERRRRLAVEADELACGDGCPAPGAAALVQIERRGAR